MTVPEAPVRRRRLWPRLLLVGLLLGALGGAGGYGCWWLSPRAGRLAQGLRFEQAAVATSDTAEELVRRRAAQLLARRVKITHGDRTVVDATVAALGGTVDDEYAVGALQSVARRGSLLRRLDEAWRARQGKIAVTLPFRLPAEPLAERLIDYKLRFDHKPVSATWDFAAAAPNQHRDGEVIDIHAAVSAIREALLAPPVDMDVALELPIVRVAPAATTDVVAAIDRSVVLSTYSTNFAFHGNQAGRAQNINRAARGINGLVMMPGEAVSFNGNVGPRSLDNGFAQAGEIYKGELRMGIGGGTCQVASTFHAAAFFGGLEVVERSPHSRPSGYIGIGLDATVAYPHVDLRMSNPFEFPIVVRATVVNKGTLKLELLGRERPATVEFAAATVGVKAYKRKVREAHWLEEGRIIRKQAGRKGVTIEKIRRIRYGDGTSREEKTTDHYPPTNEVYYVPPGTDVAEALPPLPEDV